MHNRDKLNKELLIREHIEINLKKIWNFINLNTKGNMNMLINTDNTKSLLKNNIKNLISN